MQVTTPGYSSRGLKQRGLVALSSAFYGFPSFAQPSYRDVTPVTGGSSWSAIIVKGWGVDMGAAAASSRFLRFGVFEVDLRAGELHKNGLKVKLQPNPF